MDTGTFVVLFFLLHIVLPFIVIFALYLWKGYHK
jgi:hypothetical protein